MKASILIVVFSDLQRDIRVARQIRFLKEQYHVEAVGYTDPCIDGVGFHRVFRPEKRGFISRAWKYAELGSRFYESYYWSHERRRLLSEMCGRFFDLVIANDIDTLPLALRLRARKVVFDAHEYYPRQFEDRWEWSLFFRGYYRYLCKRYMQQAHRMICVCQGIADEYRREYGVQSTVITNAADRADLKPTGVRSTVIRLVHHGQAIRSRRIENMIRIMDHVDDRFRLDLMLIPSDRRYFQELRYMSREMYNVRFVEPVPMHVVIATLNHYDVGLYLLEPSNFNTLHALPNKFFDFIQARLAIAVGPSKEMAHIVERYKLGVVAPDFKPESLARSLNELTEDRIRQHKENSDRYSRELSAERNKELLLSLVAQCLDKRVESAVEPPEPSDMTTSRVD